MNYCGAAATPPQPQLRAGRLVAQAPGPPQRKHTLCDGAHTTHQSRSKSKLTGFVSKRSALGVA